MQPTKSIIHGTLEYIMFYGNTQQDTRRLFFTSWEKYRNNAALTPLEQQLVDVICLHPEYHALLESSSTMHQSYFPELGQTNPFLHMGLHLAIRDQVTTDRPAGIAQIYQQLLKKYHDTATVEHLMMDHLAECLWQAQRDQCAPNEIAYLSACQKLSN